MEERCKSSYERLFSLAKEKSNPEFQMMALFEMSRYLRDKGELEESEKLLDNVFHILKENKIPNSESTYFLERSINDRLKGNHVEALANNDLSINVILKGGDKSKLANIYSNRGRIYRHLGKTDSAEVCYIKAEAISLTYNEIETLPPIYNNLGNIAHVKGRYDEAIGYYIKSINLKEKKDDKRGLSIGYHNIGAIKNDMQAYDEAIAQFKKSDNLANEIDFKIINIHNALKIGWAYQMKENYERSLQYHTKALQLARNVKFKKGETSALIGIGVDQTNLGNLELANISLFEGLAQAEETGNKSEECSALVALADWFTRLEGSNYNFSTKMSTNDIEQLLLRAKGLSQEMDYGEKKLLVYDGLNKLYEQTGESSKKAKLLQEYMELKDSLFSDNRSEAITRWETKYTTAEKEKEIIKLEADNKIARFRTRVWQLALLGAALLFGMLGFFGFEYQKRKNAQKQMEEAEHFRSKLSSDLHDDVGTMLSSLAMQTDVMGLTASSDQVQKFEKLSSLSREAMSRMRDTVWAIDSRKDKVEDLIDRMKDYLTDILNGHQLKVDFLYDLADDVQKLQPDLRQNIYLIFKEAVNNAVKYSNGNKLTIKFIKSKKFVSLFIHDNGNVDAGSIKTSGTGINNMKMRARSINANFNIDYSDGFSIKVKIPEL